MASCKQGKLCCAVLYCTCCTSGILCLALQGAIDFKNGDRFEGEFRHNEIQGFGELRCLSGLMYRGDWRHSKVSRGTYSVLYVDFLLSFKVCVTDQQNWYTASLLLQVLLVYILCTKLTYFHFSLLRSLAQSDTNKECVHFSPLLQTLYSLYEIMGNLFDNVIS